MASLCFCLFVVHLRRMRQRITTKAQRTQSNHEEERDRSTKQFKEKTLV